MELIRSGEDLVTVFPCFEN